VIFAFIIQVGHPIPFPDPLDTGKPIAQQPLKNAFCSLT